MKRVVQLYIEGQRVETFKDEDVQISSTIQAIADLSKVFTDFSQSFSVPASSNNNEIFQHFYENDVDFQNGVYIDHNIRRDAVIEIDSTEFRRGKIQLEKANLKDGQPYSYQITFYGLLTSLKEIFGDLKLEDLDYTGFTHDVTYAEIKDRIEDGATDYDIRYPLISNERYWQLDITQDYLNPVVTENINTALGSINVFTLFPAFKLSKLVEVIENTFNIDFEGNFLLDEKFLKAFQYMKKSITPAYLSPPEDIDFTELQEFDIATGVNTTLATEPTVYTLTIGTNLASIVFNLDTNSITLGYIEYLFFGGLTSDVGTHTINASIFVTPSTNVYYVDVYKNGVLFTSVMGSSSSILTLVEVDNTNNPSLNDTYSFKFRSTQGTTPLSFSLEYYFIQAGAIYTQKRYILPVASITTTNSLDLSQFAPDIKIVDWFSDMLKLFNLTCYGTDETTYKIETIEQWYNLGDIHDITEFTEVTSIDISRIKLFKRIEFSYAKSENILNKQFAQLFNRNFGDLVDEYDFDGSEYKISVGFENILQNRFTDTNVQVGFCLKENLSAYVPKPIILYMYNELPLPAPVIFPILNKSVVVNDGVGVTPTTNYLPSYMPFGQDAEILATNYSLNWGAENSSLLDIVNTNGLYDIYYKGYIENLYNPKNRITKVKSRLPLSTLTNLDLNDRVVIRDKRYIIDTMKTNLNTGVVDFTLYNDFRSMLADGGQIEEIDITSDAQCIDVWIELPKTKYAIAGKVVQLVTSVAGVTITPFIISESQFVTICVPANPNGTTYIIEEELAGVSGVHITTEDNNYFIEDQGGITQNIVITVQSTIYSVPVTIVTNYIYLNQLGQNP